MACVEWFLRLFGRYATAKFKWLKIINWPHHFLLTNIKEESILFFVASYMGGELVNDNEILPC